ncbi:MAG: CRTAC1 family protein [Deltaproteobacteria bacterium]|nr:CRTAC1 family protein [Deltaproteobacteria bacterium]
MKRRIVSLEAVVLTFIFTLGCIKTGPPIRFKDASNSAGVADVGINAASVAFGDYDNDGDQDMYVGTAETHQHNRLWENDGKGNFNQVATLRGVANEKGLARGLSWGDYDNDGDQDLIIANMDSRAPGAKPPLTTLYKNLLIETGQPNFENVTVSAGILRKGNPEDIARGGIAATGAGIGWGDYNNDGYLDIYWRNADYDVDNILFKNNGDGTFTDVTAEAGVGIIGKVIKANSQGSPNWVDFNNDGRLDLLVCNEGDKNILFHNNGDGTFKDITKSFSDPSGLPFLNPGNANGACWGDIDNDGDLDCYIANADQANRLIRNNLSETGAANFTDITMTSGTGDLGGARGCTMGDYDNDGLLDIYVSNGGLSNVLINDVIEGFPPFVQFYIAVEPANNVLYKNNGDGTFSDLTKESKTEGFGIGRGVASGDVDGDGFLDIFVTNTTYYSRGKLIGVKQQNQLFRNEGNQNNWIKVKLVGTVSNRDGIGAHVKVVSGDLTQLREVTSATGYNSADDLPVEFGLGRRTTVDSVEVTWPSGTVQTLTNTGINQMVTISESPQSGRNK